LKYYLAKTDPDTYSIDQLASDKKTIWDGVHNYQAISYIKLMDIGDTVFIYHSLSDKAILGIAKVIGEPFENKEDPRYSWAVELEFAKHTKPLTLAEMKSEPLLKDLLLIKNPRLSTMPISNEIANWIVNKIT
jgi:predicted RNA-binding protein with PUA-like domain